MREEQLMSISRLWKDCGRQDLFCLSSFRVQIFSDIPTEYKTYRICHKIYRILTTDDEFLTAALGTDDFDEIEVEVPNNNHLRKLFLMT